MAQLHPVGGTVRQGLHILGAPRSVFQANTRVVPTAPDWGVKGVPSVVQRALLMEGADMRPPHGHQPMSTQKGGQCQNTQHSPQVWALEPRGVGGHCGAGFGAFSGAGFGAGDSKTLTAALPGRP